MRTLMDQNLFTQVGLDSGELTMLGAIVHKFPEPGDYRGVVLRNGEAEATFTLSVDPASAASQVHIDLALPAARAKTDCCGGAAAAPVYVVSPQGYAVFHVSQGAGGYAAHAGMVDRGPQPKAFDSRELKAGDIFTATLIRPGTYTASGGEKGHCEIKVSYPRAGKTAYRPPAPARVEFRDGGFHPGRIELQPAQGLVFDLRQPARIKIDLMRPDDGPQKSKK